MMSRESKSLHNQLKREMDNSLLMLCPFIQKLFASYSYTAEKKALHNKHSSKILSFYLILYFCSHQTSFVCVAQKEYFMLSTLNSTFAFRKTKTLFHGHVLCFNKYCLISLFHSSYLTTILSNVQAIVCEFLIGKVTDLRILTICLETCGMLV